jgi:hypothetical protein
MGLQILARERRKCRVLVVEQLGIPAREAVRGHVRTEAVERAAHRGVTAGERVDLLAGTPGERLHARRVRRHARLELYTQLAA